jgi:DNA-binding NarL/FixJ family response regulator
MVSGEDDYTRELETDHGQALWRAELSDGRVVVMDDGRPGVDPPSAWLRLADEVRRTGVRVVRLWPQFRDNAQRDCLPANAEGYFLAKAALGMWGLANTLHFMLVGYLQGDEIVLQRWSVPELILVEVERRDAKAAGDCLIRNPHGSAAHQGLG